MSSKSEQVIAFESVLTDINEALNNHTLVTSCAWPHHICFDYDSVVTAITLSNDGLRLYAISDECLYEIILVRSAAACLQLISTCLTHILIEPLQKITSEYMATPVVEIRTIFTRSVGRDFTFQAITSVPSSDHLLCTIHTKQSNTRLCEIAIQTLFVTDICRLPESTTNVRLALNVDERCVYISNKLGFDVYRASLPSYLFN